MISIILLILASVCNSVMDTLGHHHSTSVFKKYKTGFWADAYLVSWKNKYFNGDKLQGRKRFLGFVIPVQFTDAWHFFKSMMIILLILSIVLYTPLVFYIWIDFIAYGIIWILFFNLFYNYLLRRK